MNKFKVLIAGIALGFLGFFPAAVLADDELDVTMEVLDSVADIDGEVIVMQGPDGEDAMSDDDEFDDESEGRVADERESDESAGEDEISDEEVNEFFAEEAAREDEFEGNPAFQSDESNDGLGNVDDFEVGEDIDDEEFQEEEMPMPNDDMEEDIVGSFEEDGADNFEDDVTDSLEDDLADAMEDDFAESDELSESDEAPSDGDAV